MKFASIVAFAAAVLAASSAHAQKSKDTLRHVQQDNVASVDEWLDPRPEVEFSADNAFDNIIGFDPVKHEYVGILAKSFRRVDPKTLEFDLHDNVTWSDGQKFTADDVVYTFHWVLDPNTKLRFREAYTWIDHVEKLGDYKVRIVSTLPIPWDLARLSTQTNILPKHVHEKLDEKLDFGRAPVGTGPYRFIQVDKNTGLVAVKRDYPQASSAKPAPTIGKLVVTAAPDIGTTTALILSGQVDIARNIPNDQAEAIIAGGQYKRSVVPSQGSQYLMVDVVGRSGKKELTDPRVREAIMAAIDTDAYITIAFGEKSGITRPKALCSDSMVACAHSVEFVKHDPARAKQLLAEAGYKDGFDLVINAIDGAQRQIAQLMAGQLRAVGIRASIELNTFATYRDKQRDGKLQLLINGYGGGGLPDVAQMLNFFFNEDPRNYHGHPEFFDLAKRANLEMDPKKREDLVRDLFDDVTKTNYLVPLIPGTNTLIYSKDLKFVDGAPARLYGFTMGDIAWQ